jgi:DnaK suppressor protein
VRSIVNEIADERSRANERDESGDLSVVPFHPADLGSDQQETDTGLSNATRASAELAEIDAALERLYAEPDSFGRDEASGAEIPFERLDLIPWARTRI